jgi:hypothetical protein
MQLKVVATIKARFHTVERLIANMERKSKTSERNLSCAIQCDDGLQGVWTIPLRQGDPTLARWGI